LIGWVAAMLLPQAEEVLLNELQLLSKALDNPITGVGDWAALGTRAVMTTAMYSICSVVMFG
jgi:hypothetical protein